MSPSDPVPPLEPTAPPSLTDLREADGSGLALWSAVLMAGSVFFAFLADAPAEAPPSESTVAAGLANGALAAAVRVPTGWTAARLTTVSGPAERSERP